MEKLVCTSCGAPIDPKRGICEYCGSRYRIDYVGPQPIQVMVEHPRVQRIGARCSIPLHAAASVLTPNELREIAMSNLTHSIAESLAGYMDFKTNRNYATDSIDIDAGLRVVPPEFRF